MEVGKDEEDKEEDDEAKKIKQLYGKFNAYVSQVPCWDLIRPNTIWIWLKRN